MVQNMCKVTPERSQYIVAFHSLTPEISLIKSNKISVKEDSKAQDSKINKQEYERNW